MFVNAHVHIDNLKGEKYEGTENCDKVLMHSSLPKTQTGNMEDTSIFTSEDSPNS